MAVTVDSVRTRYGVPSTVDDTLLGSLLTEATTQIQGQQSLFGVHYNTALTALTAHKAYRYRQMVTSDNGSGQQVDSESFVDKSFAYGSTESTGSAVLAEYRLTVPGRDYLRIITQRGRRLRPFTT